MPEKDGNQESEHDDPPENEEADTDAEIGRLLDEIDRLSNENASLNTRLGECESAIAELRQHKHEPEPEPTPEPLPEPEPIPVESHWYYRRIGSGKA